MCEQTLVIAMTDPSAVGQVRREASRLAETMGFSQVKVGEIAIAATEVATNLIKHAQGGDFILRVSHSDRELEFFALDEGPGMENLHLCLQDGYSSTQTAGGGFGALRRLADCFDIYTKPGSGTTLYCRFQAEPTQRLKALNEGGLNLPFPGETLSGDAFSFRADATYEWALLLDSLGHGPEAYETAMVAVESFHRSTALAPEECLRDLHLALARTRGAAVAIARIDREKGELLYSAIGNISGQIYADGKTQGLISHDGIVGQNARKFLSFSYKWSNESTLLLFSDGFLSRTRFDEAALPRLVQRDPEVIAGALMKNYRRGRDDASVLVLQSKNARGPVW